MGPIRSLKNTELTEAKQEKNKLKTIKKSEDPLDLQVWYTL